MDARPPVDRRWELGRWVARALCAVFALIGALPLMAAALVSSGPLTRWAERETARVLQHELGVAATYGVELRLPHRPQGPRRARKPDRHLVQTPE